MKIQGKPVSIDSTPKQLKGGNEISKDANGAYTLNLTDKNDKVAINQNAKGTWDISVNGKQLKLNLTDAELKNFTLNTKGGDDTVTVNGNLKNPININGGDGTDNVKLSIDKDKQFVTDHTKVKFDAGKRYEGDSFEYGLTGAKQGERGHLLRTITTRTEVYK